MRQVRQGTAAVLPGLARGGEQRSSGRITGRDLQHQAWQSALANRAAHGSLPSGKAIAARYGRHER